MTVEAMSVAMEAVVKPHEKLLLIHVSDSVDDHGNYRREWLESAREWAGLTQEEMAMALLGLQLGGWYVDAVDEEGFACIQFAKLADRTINPEFYRGAG